MGDSSLYYEPGAHCTPCRQLNRLETVLSRCRGGLNPFQMLSGFRLPGRRFSLRVSFTAWLCFSERDSQLLVFTLTRSDLVNLISFRDFLKLCGVVYLPVLGAFCRMGCFNLGGNHCTTARQALYIPTQVFPFNNAVKWYLFNVSHTPHFAFCFLTLGKVCAVGCSFEARVWPQVTHSSESAYDHRGNQAQLCSV